MIGGLGKRDLAEIQDAVGNVVRREIERKKVKIDSIDGLAKIEEEQNNDGTLQNKKSIGHIRVSDDSANFNMPRFDHVTDEGSEMSTMKQEAFLTQWLRKFLRDQNACFKSSMQLNSAKAVLEGKDSLLIIMPTGAGKTGEKRR